MFSTRVARLIAGKVGYTLIPAGPGGKTQAGLFTWSLGLSKATKNKEAAWLFLQWATAQRTLLNATLSYRNYNPSRASISLCGRLYAWVSTSYATWIASRRMPPFRRVST